MYVFLFSSVCLSSYSGDRYRNALIDEVHDRVIRCQNIGLTGYTRSRQTHHCTCRDFEYGREKRIEGCDPICDDDSKLVDGESSFGPFRIYFYFFIFDAKCSFSRVGYGKLGLEF